MTSIFEIEREAQRLERRLAMSLSPEVQLVLGTEFFRLFRDCSAPGDPDPYLTQFMPRLADAAAKADAESFFPNEADAIAEFARWVEGAVGGIHARQARTVAGVAHSAQQFLKACVSGDPPGDGRADGHGSDPTQVPVTIGCLFVEQIPDSDLPPRGRLLKLKVTAGPISGKSETDDVVVRNPVTKTDDRFLAQARDSVGAARSYLNGRYALPLGNRYRIDFAVDSAGARFTGDSLGVAFAVGAIVALAGTTVLRQRLSVSHSVAFTGSLSRDGVLGPVDGVALREKINRAFFSRLENLVIPRRHIREAWSYLSELETRYPKRTLRLVDAETLDVIAADARLIPARPYSRIEYTVRKIWSAKRAPAVELTAIATLAAVLLLILWPYWDRNPARVRIVGNELVVLNDHEKPLWAKQYPCDSLLPSSHWVVSDIDGDGQNEVLFCPNAGYLFDRGTWLEAYKSNGDTLFTRDIVIRREYFGDSIPIGIPVYYESSLNVVHLATGAVIIAGAFQHNPARQHLTIWNAQGDLKAWYINAGGAGFSLACDLTGDSREEMIFLAFNNRMGCSGVFAIRADSSFGCSPPYQDSTYPIAWVRRGNQVHYVLFPVTDVGKIDLPQRYNSPSSFTELSDSTFRFNCGESGLAGCDVDYYLDDRFRVIRAVANDRFISRRETLVARDSLPAVSWSRYTENLRNAVIYWIDSSWVTEGQLRQESHEISN